MRQTFHSVDSDYLSILYVSDSCDRANAISTDLSSHSGIHSVEIINDPTLVLDLVETRRVDCLVLDVEMTSRSGSELLSIVRAMESTLPVILVAGDGSAVTRQEALTAGAADYVEREANQQHAIFVDRLKDAIDQQSTAVLVTDGGYTDLSAPPIPIQQLVDTETSYELVSLIDRIASELPSVSDSNVWLFESSEERLELAEQKPDDPYQPPPSVVADAFETGDPQLPGREWPPIIDAHDAAESVKSVSEQTAESADNELRVAYPLGTVGVISVTVDTVTPTIQKTLTQLSAIAGACLEHNREYARIEQRLHQAADRNQTLSQFARTVAHDLNSPLSVIYGRIELSLAEPSEADIHLQAALNAAQRVDSLITDHLQTIETVDAESETEIVSVQTVATDAWRIIDPLTARLQIEPQLKTVEANAIRLQQLFENLIRNAIEHGSEESVGLAATSDETPDSVFDDDIDTVTVTIKPTPTGFAVCDDGPGIPEPERTEVFKSGYTTTESGSGLGLHIVSEIVEAHGWEISISESQSGGTRFDIITDQTE